MPEQTLNGIPASDGIAIGPAYCYIQPEMSIPARRPETVDGEMLRFQSARQQAHVELQGLYDSVKARAGEKEACIFEAHQMMLADPMLELKVREQVQAGEIIERAVLSASNELADLLAGMADELFAARALDVKDVGCRLLR